MYAFQCEINEEKQSLGINFARTKQVRFYGWWVTAIGQVGKSSMWMS